MTGDEGDRGARTWVPMSAAVGGLAFAANHAVVMAIRGVRYDLDVLLPLYAAVSTALTAWYAWFLWCLARAAQVPWRALFLIGVLLAAAHVPTPPQGSIDAFTYAVHGYHHVERGISPYVGIPSEALDGPHGEALAALGYHRAHDHASPYGPLWSLVESSVWSVTRDVRLAVDVFQVLGVAALALCALLLARLTVLRGDARAAALLSLGFLWNPVVLVEAAWDAHFDVLLYACVLGAVLRVAAAPRGWSWALLATGAIALKPLAAIFVPALLIRTGVRATLGAAARFGLVCAATLAACYAPFWEGLATLQPLWAHTRRDPYTPAFAAASLALAVALAWRGRSAPDAPGAARATAIPATLLGGAYWLPWYSTGAIGELLRLGGAGLIAVAVLTWFGRLGTGVYFTASQHYGSRFDWPRAIVLPTGLYRVALATVGAVLMARFLSRRRRGLAAAGVAALALALAPPAEAQRASRDGSETIFERGPIHSLRLVVPPDSEARLREAPRSYAPCEVWVDGQRLTAAGLKLKGAAGSYRDYDDRPAFTVRTDKCGGEAVFHGLEKFHLNNSVQDESYLHEYLGSALFRDAGIPAARVGHALVSVNDRDLGLYVLKEGFDERFLARWYDDPTGNLYDGGFCQDVDAALERDAGAGPKDGRDVAALAEACGGDDMVARWAALERRLDVPLFVRFMALESLIGHWDGYTINTNNYRLYFRADGKAEFLPHGMDQLFGEPEASVLDMPTSLVAASVMKRPEWRKLYRKELTALTPELAARALTRRIAPVQARIQAALGRHDRDAADAQAERHRELVARLEARDEYLASAVRAPEPKPLVFRSGIAAVVPGWRTHSEVEDAALDTYEEHGATWHTIAVGASGHCVASFRRSVLLARGRYRLEALVRVDDVEPLADDEPLARGAALRVSGAAPSEALAGTATRGVRFEFEVEEETRDVELMLELRAAAGKLRVRANTLKLTRI